MEDGICLGPNFVTYLEIETWGRDQMANLQSQHKVFEMFDNNFKCYLIYNVDFRSV